MIDIVRRGLAYTLAGLAAAGWLACWYTANRADAILAADLAPIMRAGGWVPIDRGPVERPDGLPTAARPVAELAGHVDYGSRMNSASGGAPARRTPEVLKGPQRPPPSGPEGIGPISPATPGAECSILPNDLAGGCRTEIAELAGEPWARVFWNAKVRLPSGREVERGPILAETVRLRIDRRVDVSPPARLAMLPRRPGEWRAGWAAGVGLGVGFNGEPDAGVYVIYGVQF